MSYENFNDHSKDAIKRIIDKYQAAIDQFEQEKVKYDSSLKNNMSIFKHLKDIKEDKPSKPKH